MPVRFKIFRGRLASWEELFGEAAEFAGRIPADRLISISHSEDDNEGVVTVWYHGAEPALPGEPARGVTSEAIQAEVPRRGEPEEAEDPGRGDDAIACMECGRTIPAGAERCAACGWSWR